MKQDLGGVAGTAGLVSVVIPTYNHADFLAVAIRSVQAQTYRPIEIIVVDNFSTDETERVVSQSAHPSPTYIKFANQGIIAASRNVGIRAAAGEYVAFLDADDIWSPNKLERQIAHLRDPAVVLVASDLQYTGAAKYSPSRLGDGPSGSHDYEYADIVRNNPIATSSVLVRRSELERVGGFDESPEFRVIEDWDLWLRLAVNGRARVIAEKLVTYRIAPSERSRMPILSNKLRLLDKHVRLGHLRPADLAAAARSVHFAMGVATFPTDAFTSRENFRAARKLAPTKSSAAVAAIATAATHLPKPLRFASLRALRWANKWARFA